jgi:hypothetical protein
MSSDSEALISQGLDEKGRGGAHVCGLGSSLNALWIETCFCLSGPPVLQFLPAEQAFLVTKAAADQETVQIQIVG